MIKAKRVVCGAFAATVAAGAVVVAPAGHRSSAFADAAAESRSADASTAGLREIMRRLTTVDGAPGALMEARGRRGGTVLTSGVADVESRAPMRGGDVFRIGSMTKPFVATVVLQLVAEHRVVLDAPVERYLPGVVRRSGNDGRRITVRQLLQHTSGLPDYLSYLDMKEVIRNPLAHHDVRDLVDLALAHPPTFEPGKGWRYSNTNYLLAGMLIERVTGRSFGEEIRDRIITPLHLGNTHVPATTRRSPARTRAVTSVRGRTRRSWTSRRSTRRSRARAAG